MKHFEKTRENIKIEEKIKNDKDLLFGSKFSLIWMVIVLVLSIFISPLSEDYNKVQNGLFISSVLVIITSLALIHLDKTFKLTLNKVISRNYNLELLEKSYLFWTLNFVLALIGLLIVDMSFFENGAFRIGTVIITSIGKILYSIVINRG